MTPTLLPRGAGVAMILLALAAAGFGFIVWTIAAADHDAMRAALIAAPRPISACPIWSGASTASRRAISPNARAWRSSRARMSGRARLCRGARRHDPAERQCRDVRPPATGAARRRRRDMVHHARYWHGSLTLHRLVLSAYDYATLKAVTGRCWQAWG